MLAMLTKLAGLAASRACQPALGSATGYEYTFLQRRPGGSTRHGT